MGEDLLIISIITASIRMAVPIAFAAIAGTISERAGIIALGLEGYMIIGAFFGVVGSYMSGSAIVGVGFSAIAGGLIALLLAFVCIKYESNQIVAGVGINILAPGLVALLMVAIWDNKGKSESVQGLSPIEVPLIHQIPILGDIVSGHTILVYLLIVVMIVSWVIIYKTPIGIRLRATGENAEVIDSLGLGSSKIKYISVIISGMLAGIGGAYLSLSQLDFYSKDMVAGRGFIAVAVFVFARWNPVACVVIALLFGFTEAIQLRMQSFPIPSQFLQMIPYACTVIALAMLGLKNHTKKVKETSH